MREFIEYLKKNKNASENTLIAYERDIAAFQTFLSDARGKCLNECTESDAVAYVLDLNNANRSKSTINRKVSALRTFYDHRIDTGEVTDNPFGKIRTVKGESRQIDYLTVEEVGRLLAAPNENRKGIRDRALMEFMYGTGARVTEIVRLRYEDINLRMGFVTLKDANDENRIVPLGRYAKDAVAHYLDSAYANICGREAGPGDYVFVNMRGEALTRQGIWKILRDYGDRLGFSDRMTPQVLRDSFAVHILQNGGDLKTLQELMGFDDMSVGIAYLSVTEIHVREVFARCHPRA